MPQPKDKDWLNGYKDMIPIYAVLKRPTLKQDTYRVKVKGWKKIFHANRDQKKAGVAVLILDKIDFKERVKRQRWILHNDQRINPRRRDNNHKYICTQDRCTTIWWNTNANKHERGNQQ